MKQIIWEEIENRKEIIWQETKDTTKVQEEDSIEATAENPETLVDIEALLQTTLRVQTGFTKPEMLILQWMKD